jgi:thymidylate synthase (FAD)
MSAVKLVWATPNAEQLVSDMARVSNPANQGKPPGKLLGYCVRNAHWSIFEMVSACFEIETTRDIARQILRHRSFSFQEFSQRYASVDDLPAAPFREARLQDNVNRQNSIETDDPQLRGWWSDAQERVDKLTGVLYQEALNRGIAKEVARAILPEGLTTSRMYMAGTLRSWMHFCKLRSGNGTQKECSEIAQTISAEMAKLFPLSWVELMKD